MNPYSFSLLDFLQGFLEEILQGCPKTCENLEQIVPRPSKIEPWGLQNRAWSPPRRHFYKTLNLRRFKWADATIFGGQKSQLGSILEAQEGPKSKPKREKINVGKRHIFDIDFVVFGRRFWSLLGLQDGAKLAILAPQNF